MRVQRGQVVVLAVAVAVVLLGASLLAGQGWAQGLLGGSRGGGSGSGPGGGPVAGGGGFGGGLGGGPMVIRSIGPGASPAIATTDNFVFVAQDGVLYKFTIEPFDLAGQVRYINPPPMAPGTDIGPMPPGAPAAGNGGPGQ
jgi:hypothetical protein